LLLDLETTFWFEHHDGDVFFTATTSEVENPDLSEIALGVLASELAWDAVLSCLAESKSPDSKQQ
jgi:hypothetical protein